MFVPKTPPPPPRVATACICRSRDGSHLEIIRIPGIYRGTKKVEIAKRHLIPKQRSSMG